MMSMMKKRREAERSKKLEEQFVKKDSNRNGRITAEQMIQIFKENEVQGNIFSCYCLINITLPVCSLW